MRHLIHTTLLAACLLIAGGLGDRLAAQFIEEFTANKGAKKLKVQTNSSPASTSSVDFSTLTSTSLSIPTGQTGRFVIRFGGESTCNGGNAGGICLLFISLDGSGLAKPAESVTFDSDDSGDNFPESHVLERISDVLGPGNHSIEVVWAVFNPFGGGLPTFTLDDWVFTVELWRVS